MFDFTRTLSIIQDVTMLALTFLIHEANYTNQGPLGQTMKVSPPTARAVTNAGTQSSLRLVLDPTRSIYTLTEKSTPITGTSCRFPANGTKGVGQLGILAL